jgi:hypothetical protein
MAVVQKNRLVTSAATWILVFWLQGHGLTNRASC